MHVNGTSFYRPHSQDLDKGRSPLPNVLITPWQKPPTSHSNERTSKSQPRAINERTKPIRDATSRFQDFASLTPIAIPKTNERLTVPPSPSSASVLSSSPSLFSSQRPRIPSDTSPANGCNTIVRGLRPSPLVSLPWWAPPRRQGHIRVWRLRASSRLAGPATNAMEVAAAVCSPQEPRLPLRLRRGGTCPRLACVAGVSTRALRLAVSVQNCAARRQAAPEVGLITAPPILGPL